MKILVASFILSVQLLWYLTVEQSGILMPWQP